MEELQLKFEAVVFSPVKLVGKKTTELKDMLMEHKDKVSPKGDIVIWMGEYNSETKSFTEIPGVFMKSDCDINEETDICELPHCTMGILSITGKTRSIYLVKKIGSKRIDY